MKPYLPALLVVMFGLGGCAADNQVRLPHLTGVEQAQKKDGCAAVFPEGKWQFVHAIDFAMHNGSGTPVIGVINLAGNKIACALITIEGLTLFEAVFHDGAGYQVRRAVPPFNGPEFAKGLIRDIRAMFWPPPGRVHKGRIAGTTAVCRYEDPGVGVVDVLPDVDDCWQINSYTADLTMDRSIVGRSCRKKGSSLIPDSLELKTYGRNGYTLKMTLISADNFQ